MQVLRYRMLKYMPDPVLAKEVVNIGLIAEIEGGLHERHLSSWEKVLAIDTDADIGLIESSIRSIFNAFKKRGNLKDESVPTQTPKQKVRISGTEEIKPAEGEALVLAMEMIHARLVEGRKDELPQIKGTTPEEASHLVTSPERRKQVEEGRISEVRMDVEKLGRKDIADIEYLTVLTLSDDEADWVAAWNEVNKSDIREPRLFISLAYRFWFVGKVELAISISEEGLKRVDPDNEEIIYRIKNNVAYYYAELRRPENRDDAFRYSQEAMEHRKDAYPVDTRGYVLISYGENADDILKGVKLCEDARREGGITFFPLYQKHIARAYKQLKELRAIQ